MPNQGGTHEQHVKAGQQSHKNDDKTRQASGNKSEDNRGGKGILPRIARKPLKPATRAASIDQDCLKRPAAGGRRRAAVLAVFRSECGTP